jgi:nucleoside 2-deoxyribosyltransferase
MRRIYLAGPEVFLPDPQPLFAEKLAICAAHGLMGINPLEAVLDADVDEPPDVLARKLFDGYVATIRACEGVIANMTPFRGPSADVGTVWEAGFAYGRGKPVICYSNTTVPLALRTRLMLNLLPDQLTVEDFGLNENLMVQFGGLRWFCADPPTEALWTDLSAFSAAVEAMALGLND